jgi:hypothetical protein
VIVGLAVVVGVVLGIAVFAVPRLTGGADEEEDAVAGELMTVSDGLVTALSHERLLAALDQVGHADLLVLPVQDTPAARRATDAVIAQFETVLSDEGDQVGSHYEGSLSALNGLDELRGEIDGRAAPALGVGYATEVLGRYDEIVGALHEGNASLLGSTIDDTELRSGLELMAVSHAAVDAVPRLMVAIAADIGTLATPEAVANVAAVQADLQEHLASATSLAEGTPYAGAVEELEADLTEAELQQIVDAALQSGQAEIFEFVTSALSSANAWQSFAGDVEDTMTEGVDA